MSTSESDLVEFAEKQFARCEEKVALIAATKIAAHKAFELPSLEATQRAFSNLRSATKETVVGLENLIQTIVDEHEYGNNLQ
jgi:hypothetical protein